jgi:hypothetical protein
MRQRVRNTYGGLVFKSEGFNKRLKLLDIREATGHLGNFEITTGSDA